jgi:hypothetical protein
MRRAVMAKVEYRDLFDGDDSTPTVQQLRDFTHHKERPKRKETKNEDDKDDLIPVV